MVMPIALLLLLNSERLLLAEAFSPPRIVNRVQHPLRILQRSSCDVFQIPRSTTNSRVVTSLSVASSDFAAGGTLVLSSVIGMISEKFNFSGGHVVTLLSAALLSNTSRMVPTDHMLYDLCWSIFLPSSLVFALLSTSSSVSEKDSLSGPSSASSSSSLKQSSEATNVNSSILGMAVPFAAGSIGSIIGCCASFFLIKFHDIKATAILAGCLCASYIGGTVNFFAAAKILIPMFNCNNTGGGGISSLFGSLAAADLVVMAMYFSLLSFASKSKLLQSLFPSRGDVDDANKSDVDVAELIGESTSENSKGNASIGSSITAVILACFISISSVLAATDLEKKINNVANVPGLMCAFLAVFGLIAERMIGMGLNQMNKASYNRKSRLVRSLEEVAVVSPKLSNICFYLLFASVGTTADISSAIGSGPKALSFASLALVIHCATVLVGTFIGGRLIGGKLPQSTLQEVLTASNAAIGGPSTAAAFAADLVPITPSSRFISQLRRSLILGATVWGVFGYTIGTATGVTLAKALMRWV
ncbi:DUF819 domain-containing protein [Skeletonema marinoi]|uniref:DUF819 domain-containing protein n=1 Tax=Skeletonema marinoi TaxID=267567 RepID=A0AAD9DHJ8_9STRA|nr:DUF819 domain-containing protein [Skeletonema marinoi]